MKSKRVVFEDKFKLKYSLYNLARYINFLEIALFALLSASLFFGALNILLGFLEKNYLFLKNGVLITIISLAIYFLILKPILLIMYAVAKILINTEKHTE